MRKSDLVSIIIPVYNREGIIEETVESALSQDYPYTEIIIVDNCSSDKTYEIVIKYSVEHPNIKVYRNDRNLGPVRNWEKAISYATGKFLKILWSDDQIDSSFLTKTVPILQHNHDIGFIYTTTIIYGENFKRVRYRYGKTGSYPIEKFIESQLFNIRSVPVSPGNALFRLEDVRKNLVVNIDNPKGLDYSSKGAGNDLLLFLSCAKNYERFFFIDEKLSYFRAHKGSISINENLFEYYTYSKIFFLEKTNNYEKYETIFKSLIYFNWPQFRYMINENLSFKNHIVIILQRSPYIIKSVLIRTILILIDKFYSRR